MIPYEYYFTSDIVSEDDDLNGLAYGQGHLSSDGLYWYGVNGLDETDNFASTIVRFNMPGFTNRQVVYTSSIPVDNNYIYEVISGDNDYLYFFEWQYIDNDNKFWHLRKFHIETQTVSTLVTHQFLYSTSFPHTNQNYEFVEPMSIYCHPTDGNLYVLYEYRQHFWTVGPPVKVIERIRHRFVRVNSVTGVETILDSEDSPFNVNSSIYSDGGATPWGYVFQNFNENMVPTKDGYVWLVATVARDYVGHGTDIQLRRYDITDGTYDVVESDLFYEADTMLPMPGSDTDIMFSRYVAPSYEEEALMGMQPNGTTYILESWPGTPEQIIPDATSDFPIPSHAPGGLAWSWQQDHFVTSTYGTWDLDGSYPYLIWPATAEQTGFVKVLRTENTLFAGSETETVFELVDGPVLTSRMINPTQLATVWDRQQRAPLTAGNRFYMIDNGTLRMIHECSLFDSPDPGAGGTFRVYSNEGFWFLEDNMDLSGTVVNTSTTIELQDTPFTPIGLLMTGTGVYTLRAHIELTISTFFAEEDMVIKLYVDPPPIEGIFSTTEADDGPDDPDGSGGTAVDTVTLTITGNGVYAVDLEGTYDVSEPTWGAVWLSSAELGEATVEVGVGSYLEIEEP